MYMYFIPTVITHKYINLPLAIAILEEIHAIVTVWQGVWSEKPEDMAAWGQEF